MEGENKASLRRFLADQKIASSYRHEQQVIAYFQTHYDYEPQKMPLSLAV